ncbi:MAG: hypothetical protein IIW40_03765 [Clostridia bacterium]|nr:hypothetical protein [Clostridia bacterium]
MDTGTIKGVPNRTAFLFKHLLAVMDGGVGAACIVMVADYIADGAAHGVIVHMLLVEQHAFPEGNITGVHQESRHFLLAQISHKRNPFHIPVSTDLGIGHMEQFKCFYLIRRRDRKIVRTTLAVCKIEPIVILLGQHTNRYSMGTLPAGQAVGALFVGEYHIFAVRNSDTYHRRASASIDDLTGIQHIYSSLYIFLL